MSNYTQTNIYRRQMRELGLTTKQYADLIKMPYEVVKDIIYDKEGEYSMEIKDLLRQTMLNKHQDIENDYENAKYKAMQIKKNDIDYLEWYDKEYSFDKLKKVLKINGPKDFRENYRIMINGKLASKWYYSCLTSKTNYKERHIAKDVINEFARQLYDIIENNSKDYLKTADEINEEKNELVYDSDKYINWFMNFDTRAFIKNNKLSSNKIAQELGIAYSTFCQLIAKTHYSKNSIKAFYYYVKEFESRQEINTTIDDVECEKLEEQPEIGNKLFDEVLQKEDIEQLKETPQIMTTYQEPKIEIINNNDNILRKILINRLTEEEKELIRIFGGNLE